MVAIYIYIFNYKAFTAVGGLFFRVREFVCFFALFTYVKFVLVVVVALFGRTYGEHSRFCVSVLHAW